MVVISILNAADDSLSMKLNLELIPLLLKSVVNYVETHIISMSLLFFIAVERMALLPDTYIMYMYLLPLLDVIGNHPYKSE